MRHASLFAAAALLLSMAATAHAADRRVNIVNASGNTITHFYASNSGTNSWEEDILGRDTLDAGDSLLVNINDGTGACKFDFKAVFEDGSSRVRQGVDVCTISSYTYR